ncbi:hypothetical protein, partial [Parasynechococcus sp.]|uniref:hypothetical protein n=1 Tax=Parasynechococcus sp. TaxID=3101203 RepID=UPI0037040AF8
MAGKKEPGSPAYIQYAELSKACEINHKNIHTKSVSKRDFYASSPIQNSNLILGRITERASTDENDLTLIRT